MSRFAGQTALVTGAASGIGLAIAQRLLADGANVVAGDLNGDGLASLAASASATGGSTTGGQVAHIRTDVTDEADCEALVALAVARFGRLDLAFNVAGGNRAGYLLDQPEEDWQFTIDLCLKSVFLGIKHQARQMVRGAGGGAIVNIASLNAHVPMYAGAAYSTAKAGVEMLTKNAALEFADHQIRVNAVLPGLVETPLTSRHFANPDVLAAFHERIPARRAAQPDEIASPALFLASAEASYVNGASLLVDGAWAVSGYPDTRPFRGPVQFNG